MRTDQQPIRIALFAPNGRMGTAIAAAVAVDLAVTLQPYGNGARLRIANAGPSAASNVVLCFATPPSRPSGR